jgi:hypothetical protein
MNGELAQLIALVAHGNLCLNDGITSPSALIENSTFQFVSSVKFCRYKTRNDVAGVEVAGDLKTWFELLRSDKVSRLWNVAFAWDRSDMPEHVAIAFSGAVPMAVQTDLPDGYELWYPLWKTGGPENKPWQIEYRSLHFPNSHVFPVNDLGIVKHDLGQMLARAESFSRRPETNADQWAQIFSSALQLLDSPTPVIPFMPDLLPDAGFSLLARQITTAACQAFVFGGMGSWNDMSFADPALKKEYDQLSKELFQTVRMAAVVASNSFSV